MSRKNSPSVAVPILEPLLVSTKQAAKLLSISSAEIRLLVRKGSLVHKRISKTHWLISMRSLRAFADGSGRVA